MSTPTNDPERQQIKRLYRSTRNAQVAGVAAGLAEYFRVDVSLVRLLFLVLALFGGNGLLIYIVLWVVMPTEDDVRARMHKRKNGE